MNLRRLDTGEDTDRQAKCTITVSGGDVLGLCWWVAVCNCSPRVWRVQCRFGPCFCDFVISTVEPTKSDSDLIFCLQLLSNILTCTVMPAKSDSDDMFCLQSYQGL